MLAHFLLARQILQRVLERVFAGAQIGIAAVFIAGKAAFRIHVHIAEADSPELVIFTADTAGLIERVTR
jgi:hypothetical protein